MKSKFKHVIITRFNYPEDYEFMEERMRLFNKYTLPSVKNQKETNFEWIFFSDKELDIDFENKRFVTLSSYKEYKKELEKDYEYIIESRLDNDDVISPYYVLNIQKQFHEPLFETESFVVESKGYRFDKRNGNFYEDRLYSENFTSPFLSLISKLGSGKYVFDFVHGNMCKEYKTYFIDDIDWVQIIHNSNKLMNKDSEELIARRGIKCDKPWWFK